MERIRVEKVGDPKHVVGDKNGRHYDFWSYSMMANNRWYSVKGYGAENIKEGMTLQGFVTTRDYTDKEGNNKTAYEFTLVSKQVAELWDEIEKIWTAIAKLNENKQPELDIDPDEIPFN